MTMDLKELRLQRGWSQNDVAKLVNSALGRKYRRSDVSQWERGLRKIPPPVEELLAGVEPEQAPEFTVLDGDREVPFEPGDTPPPQPPSGEDAARQIAAVVGGGSYARVCEELWELVATAVGMIGAVTGSQKLQDDGKIILSDKQALGKAYGKLAEQNPTFRAMLAGMTGGGAWLEVALVSGITAGKVMRNHQTARPQVVEPLQEVPVEEPGVMRGDGAVIDFGR